MVDQTKMLEIQDQLLITEEKEADFNMMIIPTSIPIEEITIHQIRLKHIRETNTQVINLTKDMKMSNIDHRIIDKIKAIDITHLEIHLIKNIIREKIVIKHKHTDHKG